MLVRGCQLRSVDHFGKAPDSDLGSVDFDNRGSHYVPFPVQLATSRRFGPLSRHIGSSKGLYARSEMRKSVLAAAHLFPRKGQQLAPRRSSVPTDRYRPIGTDYDLAHTFGQWPTRPGKARELPRVQELTQLPTTPAPSVTSLESG